MTGSNNRTRQYEDCIIVIGIAVIVIHDIQQMIVDSSFFTGNGLKGVRGHDFFARHGLGGSLAPRLALVGKELEGYDVK